VRASWPALLVAPMLALSEQSVVYALVMPACERQMGAWLHAVPAGFLAATLLLTAMAWRQAHLFRREGAAQPHADADTVASRRYFVAWMGVGSGALSALAIVAMWLPQWVLSPCSA
jgi:hypothetical protein